MKNIIKENKIASVIILVLIVILAVVYFDKQPTKTENPTGNINLQQQINDFVKNLPVGDVDSQKCKELVDAKIMELVTYKNIANSMCESATPENQARYCAQANELVNSKYLYSHKLCITEIYKKNIDGVYDDQVIDLGSNNIFAEIAGYANHNSYYLYGQKQNNPIIISDIWSEIQKIK